MSARTIAITGAAGMIGTRLAEHFRRAGWNVRALMRDPRGDPFREPGIERARLDLSRPVSADAVAGADVVVHAAWTTRFRDLESARRVNEEGTAGLLRAVRDARVPRFLFVSSLAARPDAPSYYARSKFEVERMLDADALILRPGLVLSRDGGLARRLQQAMARTHVMPLFGGGRQIVQTVHVDDLCVVIERALHAGLSGAFNVAEPDGITMRELQRLLSRAAGVRAIPLPLPVAPVLAAIRGLEAMGVGLPVSSENLLGLTGMRHVETRADLARLGVTLRTARESLA